MLRLSAGQVESLWDEVLPGEVRELPEDLAALDVLLQDPGLLEAIASSWRGIADAWPADDLDADLCAVDGGQAPNGVGVRDAGAGGVGLAASASVLCDRAWRAGPGRVDGAQADAQARGSGW